MTQRPGFQDIENRNDFDAVVIRTCYEEEEAWQVVKAALLEPAGPSPEPSTPWIVDDPAWAGAGIDEVLTAIAADENLCGFLSVVFVADHPAIQGDHHALLAATTVTREDLDSDEEYEYLTEFGTTFRTVPAGVHEVHVNLELANMDFEDFASAAQEDPMGVFPSWWKNDFPHDA